MSETVTLRDIAKLTGVSVATVARCLGNKPGAADATKRQVLEACRKAGYAANRSAKGEPRVSRKRVGTRKRGILAFVTAFPTVEGWKRHSAPIFRQMFAGAFERASERNYQLEHFWMFRSAMTDGRFSRMLEARGIQGLLLAPVPDSHTPVQLDWEQFSTVALGLAPNTGAFHRVVPDYHQSMLLALEMCRSRGYKRPGLAVLRATLARLERRWESAYLLAPDRSAKNSWPRPLIVDEWKEADLGRWLAREKPDVVLGPALGKLEEVARAGGRKLPRDLGLVSLLVPEPGDPLSGILQDGEALGAVALDQVISQVERRETGVPTHPVTHTLPGRWNPGCTLRRSSGL